LIFIRSVRTIRMIKEIHRPFWSSLFTIPDRGKLFIQMKFYFFDFNLDDEAIDKLAENLEKTASIKN
jgi:hypothetical protein